MLPSYITHAVQPLPCWSDSTPDLLLISHPILKDSSGSFFSPSGINPFCGYKIITALFE